MSKLFILFTSLCENFSFCAFMPIFGHTSISATIRVGIAFYITIFLYPIVNLQGVFTQEAFLGAIVTEITLGLIAAMFLNVVFASVRIIGDFVGYSTALSMASMFDPATGSNEGLISRLLYWVALMLFLKQVCMR